MYLEDASRNCVKRLVRLAQSLAPLALQCACASTDCALGGYRTAKLTVILLMILCKSLVQKTRLMRSRNKVIFLSNKHCFRLLNHLPQAVRGMSRGTGSARDVRTDWVRCRVLLTSFSFKFPSKESTFSSVKPVFSTSSCRASGVNKSFGLM